MEKLHLFTDTISKLKDFLVIYTRLVMTNNNKKQPSKKALLGNSVVRLTETVQCVIHSVVIKKTYPVAAMSELEKYY